MRSRVDDEADAARRALLAIAAFAPAVAMRLASAAEAAPNAHQLPSELANAVSAYDDATLRNDTATLGNLVADDYVLVNSDATVQDKQQYLADFNLPGFRIDPYKMEQTVLQVWGDAALIAGLLRLSWSQDGERHSRLLRIAHIWVKHDDHWRMKYTQLTRVPQ